MKKRIISFGLTLLFLISYGLAGYGLGGSGMTTTVPASDSLSDYENGEVLVCYADGSMEVLSYDSDDFLARGLEALAQDESVTLIQPNYSYQNTALATDDVLSAQQWALSNDGSFQMEEQANRFPVYDFPFGMPSAPGRWIMPGGFGRPGGRQGMLWGRAYYGGTASVRQAAAATAGIDINAEEAWALYDGGSREVVVALIDTGIDDTHEDLQDVLWINKGEVAGNGVDDDGNGYTDDVYRHAFRQGMGTHGRGRRIRSCDYSGAVCVAGEDAPDRPGGGCRR